MPTLAELRRDFKKLSNDHRAKSSAWFFKTKKGQYGHGDVFVGVSVPQQRTLVKKYRDLPLEEVLAFLASPVHEHRLTSALLLVEKYKRGDGLMRARIARAYLAHRRHINNWDIVDSSAPQILGNFLLVRPRKVLTNLAISKNLWDRRIAIISTQTFIRHGQFNDTLKIAKMLRNDEHDLIHKAVGWMLREIGDRNRAAEEKFLRNYASRMPRTMLRYAIEKFPKAKRRRYLAG